MRRIGNRRTTRIVATAVAVFVLVAAIVLMVVLYRAMRTLKAVTLVPNFSETELETDTDYTFIVKSEPFNADIKSLEYNVDDPSADFSASVEPHKAILHTGQAGTVTLYVSLGKVESDRISYTVIDHSVQEEPSVNLPEDVPEDDGAAEAAEAPVEEAAEVRIVTVTGDNVRMRSEPNTDCEVVKTCEKGETYTFIEVTGEWTGVDNEGKECYIKSEFVEESVVQSEQAQAPQNASAGQEGADSAQAGAESSGNTGSSDKNAGADGSQEAAGSSDKKPDEGTKIGEGMVEVLCKDGKAMFTQAEYDYFVATWSYTGMADEMMTHHTADELHKLYNNTH